MPGLTRARDDDRRHHSHSQEKGAPASLGRISIP
jgi:hypothetical protein